MKDIQSILFTVFTVFLNVSNLIKNNFFACIKVEMEKHIGKYTRFLQEERSVETNAIFYQLLLLLQRKQAFW